MIAIPKTSVALLNAIAASPDSSRWTEFYNRYQPVIASYLQSKFSAADPPLEIDDIIQNTMIAFMKRIPTYRYAPDTHGHFRNFIVGIAKKKALGVLRRRQREAKNQSGRLTSLPPPAPEPERRTPAPTARKDLRGRSVRRDCHTAGQYPSKGGQHCSTAPPRHD